MSTYLTLQKNCVSKKNTKDITLVYKSLYIFLHWVVGSFVTFAERKNFVVSQNVQFKAVLIEHHQKSGMNKKFPVQKRHALQNCCTSYMSHDQNE